MEMDKLSKGQVQASITVDIDWAYDLAIPSNGEPSVFLLPIFLLHKI